MPRLGLFVPLISDLKFFMDLSFVQFFFGEYLSENFDQNLVNNSPSNVMLILIYT